VDEVVGEPCDVAVLGLVVGVEEPARDGGYLVEDDQRRHRQHRGGQGQQFLQQPP
jgi:hypothetical protein